MGRPRETFKARVMVRFVQGRKTLRGRIVAVVKPGEVPQGWATSRSHRSFIINVTEGQGKPGKLYWPPVKNIVAEEG